MMEFVSCSPRYFPDCWSPVMKYHFYPLVKCRQRFIFHGSFAPSLVNFSSVENRV